MRFLYPVTIGISSLLLFLVQPMMAKTLLPLFGGSAGVWLVAMLFFQTALLAGYLYSFVLTRFLTGEMQRFVHAAVLAASVGLLFMRPESLSPGATAANPTVAILRMLTRAVGLPYLMLSATSPLVQSWFAESGTARVPWRLFAVSNLASLAALVTYPFLIEPALPLTTQMRWWSAGYSLAAVLGCGITLLRTQAPQTVRTETRSSLGYRPLVWIGLAACASALWLSVANHLSQEVAPVPFLWVLPLGVYLLTFIVCFDREASYRPAWFRWLLPVAWGAAAMSIAGRGPEGLAWELAIMAMALFIICMFCHGELVRTKPATDGLTFFYLMIALGGALGGVFTAVIAPLIFSGYFELPVGIAASVLFALPLIYGITSPARLLRLGVVAAVAFVVAVRLQAGFGDLVRTRNFYGAMQVRESGEGADAVRAIYNGRTLHGVEFNDPSRARLATGYYGPESGAGRVLLARVRPMRAAFVGLGAGTLATYGHGEDEFRFFEINPAVIQAASTYFRFLSTSEAKISVTRDDGRLGVVREPPASLDVIVLDAFADDSVPMHLLTREAFEIYFDRLRADGLVAIHVTNRYLNLAPSIGAVAADLGKQAVEVHNAADPVRQVLAADWVIVGDAASLRDFGPSSLSQASLSQTVARQGHVPVWTDDYSNLFQALK